MIDQLPGLVILIPFFGAIFVGLIALVKEQLLRPLVLISLFCNSFFSVLLLLRVLNKGTATYELGAWPAPYGIQFVCDSYAAVFLTAIAILALVAFIQAFPVIPVGQKGVYYCSLFLLFLTGSQGMLISGDVFNIYVFLEVAALSGYALLGLGDSKAIFACFRYLIIGSIGASLYLLGVGYLYLKTGTLNIEHLITLTPDLYNSRALVTSFALILIGLGIKMAIFPLHGWLSQVYTHTSTASRLLVAPFATKVSICVLIRIIFSVYGDVFVFKALNWQPLILVCASFAIIGGTLWAFAQTDLRRLVTYLMIVEVGYIVGGIWLGNEFGLKGASFHIVVDMAMTLGLFSVFACFEKQKDFCNLSDLSNLCKQSPIIAVSFFCIVASMVGVPPFGGFISKWYLISGAIEAKQWLFLSSLLLSSLCIIAIFVRMTERTLGFTVDKLTVVCVPVYAQYSLLLLGLSLLVMGLFSAQIVPIIVAPLLF